MVVEICGREAGVIHHACNAEVNLDPWGETRADPQLGVGSHDGGAADSFRVGEVAEHSCPATGTDGRPCSSHGVRVRRPEAAAAVFPSVHPRLFRIVVVSSRAPP